MKLDHYCRPCRAAYKREHYAANRRREIDRAQERKRTLAYERASLSVVAEMRNATWFVQTVIVAGPLDVGGTRARW